MLILQDATNDSIPMIMVGNKADLRQAMSEQGHKCVPTSYGEKLSMVSTLVKHIGEKLNLRSVI